jgi:hypothetical protein
MKVYIVLEEDRGCGVMVIGVFATKEQTYAEYGIGGNYWIVEEEVQGL